MHILYLDFDGVLHDDEVYCHRTRGIYIQTPGRVLFEWMPVLCDLIAPYPNVNIVLSTSWVNVFSFDFAKSQLAPTLQSRVIGATYHRREIGKRYFLSLARGEQIVQDAGRREPTNWFAIDNDDAGWPEAYRHHLIKTDDALGISQVSVQHQISAYLKQL
jgi:hypothetical protein